MAVSVLFKIGIQNSIGFKIHIKPGKFLRSNGSKLTQKNHNKGVEEWL
jgi:hypothetical protein